MGNDSQIIDLDKRLKQAAILDAVYRSESESQDLEVSMMICM